jgi:hypothetical protein
VFAGVGEDLGAVDGLGDLSHLQHPHLSGHCEHLLEAALQQRAVGPAEGADAVVIGVAVRAEQAHGDVFVGGAFDLATAEGARRVGINEQAQHQRGRILRAAGAAFVDPRLADIEQVDGAHDEMHQVPLRHPVPKVRGHQQRSVVVNEAELGRHTYSTPQVGFSWGESPIGC